MNTYEIIEIGNPILPYKLNVNLDINASAEYTETVAYPISGTELNSFFAGYVANIENTFKTHPDFTTVDTDSNANFSLTLIGVNPDDETKNLYSLNYSFGVSGAIATFEKECQSSSEGEELEAFFNSKVSEVEFDFYQARPNWVKL
jgi:hypothetical protein